MDSSTRWATHFVKKGQRIGVYTRLFSICIETVSTSPHKYTKILWTKHSKKVRKNQSAEPYINILYIHNITVYTGNTE